MHDRPDAPTEVRIARPELLRHNRWNAGYFEERFRRNERALKKLRSVPLGNFIPEQLPDGSKAITYGQVGARKLSPRGGVRYLQVINIRDTGIDFAIKPDRVAEGSHNDPERSRVRKGDILLTRTTFRGMETLIGRCVVVTRDFGRVNISEDIDRIRVTGISPFYVGIFLKTKFGRLQVLRVIHGVDSQKINFGHVRSLLIPKFTAPLQAAVESEYLAMSRCHDRAMAVKEDILVSEQVDPGRFGETINSIANESARYRRAMAEADELENPFGAGLLRLDYLIHHGDVPLVTVEGEPTARQFDVGLRQARNYSRNFKPRQRGCPMQERTVPFLLTAAGTRVEMCRAIVRGLNIEYEPIRHEGRPAFLEWRELLSEAGQARPAAVVSPQQQVLVADLACQFFADLFRSIDGVAALRNRDDEMIMLFNRIIDCARRDGESGVRLVCRQCGVGARALRHVLRTIALYRQKIDSQEFTGAAVARGYRAFLLQPGGRGGHRYFTGESQSRAYRANGRVRYRNVARYFTPVEIIQQMVRLAQPRAQERVIDMTCGTGGFLAESVNHVAQMDGKRRAQQFMIRRLVGIDDDPFCVSCAGELLTFLHPQHAGEFQACQHNVLYQRAPKTSEPASRLQGQQRPHGHRLSGADSASRAQPENYPR